MNTFEIKILPKKGEPRIETFDNAERYSIMVHAYDRSNIRIECDRSKMVAVETRLPRNANYAGD